MKLITPGKEAEFAGKLNAAWVAKHGATPMPNLNLTSFDQLNDPLYRDARTIYAQVADSMAPPAPPAPAPAAVPRWTPAVGGLICPNNHYVRLGDAFCPTCGAAVNQIAAAEANQKTQDWWIKVSINQHQQGQF